jgi:hypothetical protein
MEVIASMTATSESAPAPPAERPSSAPMDRRQFMEWLGVSNWWVTKYTVRKEDPLPWIGTAKAQRILESDAIEWLRRNKGAK